MERKKRPGEGGGGFAGEGLRLPTPGRLIASQWIRDPKTSPFLVSRIAFEPHDGHEIRRASKTAIAIREVFFYGYRVAVTPPLVGSTPLDAEVSFFF